jgi:hypothetical protein
VIADISLPHERGKFVGIFQFAGTFSTASKSMATLKTHLIISRSSTGRGVLVHFRMASDLLVSHYLLWCNSRTSSLVSTPLRSGADSQPAARDAPLAGRRWVNTPTHDQLYSPGVSSKAARREAGGEGGEATCPGRSTSKSTCKLQLRL